jgi:cytoskeletal protein CcmA (bactofilin family)
VSEAAASSPAPSPRGNENTLIVGPNIRLKGEIGACDTLVVEGHIEASMDSHHIAVAEGGVFNGEVTVDTAEVAGSFDGELTVRQRLLVRTTGRIAGSVRYGALEVENGGQISGNIELLRDGARRSSSSVPAKPAVGEVSSAS